MSDRIAVVTGASTGIGKAVCERLIDEDWQVLGIARSKDKLVKMYAGLGDDFDFMVADVTDKDCAQKIFECAKTSFGRYPDTVVVNAGRGLQGSITSADMDDFDQILDLNLKSAVRLLKEASGRLDKPPCGRRDIIVLGTASAKNVSPWSSSYGATKAAIHYVTESLRRQLAKEKIRVSLIMPGWVKTEFQDASGYDEDLQNMLKEHFGEPLLAEDISRVIAGIINSPAHVSIGEVTIRPVMQDYP